MHDLQTLDGPTDYVWRHRARARWRITAPRRRLATEKLGAALRDAGIPV